MTRLSRVRAAIVLATGVTYAASAVPSVLGGDSGEMATLFAAGGIAHPPGFPTMVLWLRALHWLPCKSPAHGAALATAIAATGAVWALQEASLAWGASEGAAALASLIFACSKEAWMLGSEAEAFSLSALFAGMILLLSAPEPPLRGRALTCALGLTAGLAMGNHHTIVLLAPVGVLAAVRACRASSRPSVAASLGMGAFVVGMLAPYSYDYVLARTADPQVVPMWLEAPTLEGLVYHFRRGAYGTFSLAPASVAIVAEPVDACARFLRRTFSDLFGLPAIIAIAVAASLHQRRSVRDPILLAALVVSLVLAGPVFAAFSNLPTEGLGVRVAARFDLLPELLLALLGALALDVVVPTLRKRATLAYPALVLLALGAWRISWPLVARAHRPDVAQFEDNVLATAPEGAIIVGSGDAEWGAFLYARYAERRRLDIAFVNPGLLRQAWYRREVRSLTGVSFESAEGRVIGPKTALARLLTTGRPLFYTDWPSAKLADTPHDSYGPLMRILPMGAKPTDLETLLAANTALFEKYEMEMPPPDDPTDWGHALYSDYGRAWGELGDRFGKAHRADEAQACLAKVRAFAPWALMPVPSASQPSDD